MAHLTFPADLPVPEDDGACNHLKGVAVPLIHLQATSGEEIDISRLGGLSIVFCYPRTAGPNETVPASWNAIPGARGCTPQACSIRAAHQKLRELKVQQCFGLSTQGTSWQQEVHQRLHLPYDLLSDEKLEMIKALNLPTFEWEGSKVVKRLTLAIKDGIIIKVWYPVFPPDKSAEQVVRWLANDDDKA